MSVYASYSLAAVPPSGEYKIQETGRFIWDSGNVSQSFTSATANACANGWGYGAIDVSNQSLNEGYSSDGKFGIELAHDVILTVTGDMKLSAVSFSGTLIWELSDNSPSNLTGPSVATVEYKKGGTAGIWTVKEKGSTSPGKRWGSSNLQARIWVGPEASGGIIQIPRVYSRIGCTSPYGELVANSSIELVPPLSCVISAPPTINFGVIHLTGQEKDTDILGYVKGDLGITCNSTTATATATATATSSIYGEKRGRLTDTLAMGTMAEVRGVIGGKSVPSSGWCGGLQSSYPNNYIRWDGGNTQALGTLKEGGQSIPYAFSLCSTGKYSLGVVTAMATMNITWD